MVGYMNAPLPQTLKFEVSGLASVIADSNAYDALCCKLSPTQWDVLGSFIQPFAALQGQVVIEQGGKDRSLYFVESGQLSVHYQDEKGRVRLALVGVGSVVGEGAFFSHLPRNATVQAAGNCKLWCLTPTRFTELSNRHPALALELSMALGSVLAKRLVNRPKRVAIT